MLTKTGRKTWLKKVVLASFATLMIGALAGCGSSDKVTQLANKDTLSVGVTNFADTLEPTENYFAWVVMRYGVGETLTKFDEKMNTTPWLAKEWFVSEDKMTWTFIIDEKAKFSNGRPVTAEAVKASIERSFAKAKRATTFFEYADIKADGQKLMITTKKTLPNLPGLIADPLFLIVDVQTEKEGRNFSKEGPIGTGPYAVKSFTKEKATMVKNEHYWNGEVPFKTVEIPSIDDPNTRALSLQSGDVNVAVNIAAADMVNFVGNDKFVVDEIASLRTVVARMNHKGLLADPKVRAAVISGSDRETYAKTLLKNTFIPGKAPIPPSLDYGFDQLKDPNTYSQERAKKLLEEAGWKDTNGNGIVDKDGKELTLNFVIYNSRAELPAYAEAVQADLKKIGIDIKIKTVDYNLIDKMGIDGDYDMLISNIVTANTGDPQLYLLGYWMTNVGGNNPQNGSGYSNPIYDEKMEQLQVEFNPAKRKQLIIELQQILLDDSAALFLGYPKTNLVSSKAVTGVKMLPSDYYWITNNIKPAK